MYFAVGWICNLVINILMTQVSQVKQYFSQLYQKRNFYMNNNKLRVLAFLLFFIFCSKDSWAQLDRSNAAGVRFGGATGLSYRYAISNDRALEGILNFQSSSRTRRFRIVGLYQVHKPLVGNFSWFYGVGGSLGNVRFKEYRTTGGELVSSSSELMLSVDGILGVSFDIPSSPVSISFDAKPYLDILQESSIRWSDPFGFTVRYNF